MLGSRFTGIIFVDGKEFHNELIDGVADNTKKKVFTELHKQMMNYLVPQWIAQHKVEFHITDRQTNKTFIL